MFLLWNDAESQVQDFAILPINSASNPHFIQITMCCHKQDSHLVSRWFMHRLAWYGAQLSLCQCVGDTIYLGWFKRQLGAFTTYTRVRLVWPQCCNLENTSINAELQTLLLQFMEEQEVAIELTILAWRFGVVNPHPIRILPQIHCFARCSIGLRNCSVWNQWGPQKKAPCYARNGKFNASTTLYLRLLSHPN